ncbi:MAG: helix-turn-helix domain-containing protein [Deltaproteobacteria bacterium]|nr:helix-turn-helix domain-containing protein [Deltaproteobacteria bacterium]
MGVKYTEVIERMKSAGKLKNDSRVARALGVTPQALSNYKKRGNIPADLVLKFSGIYGTYVDWLITGEGDTFRAGYGSGEDASVITSAREEVMAYGNLAEVTALSPEEIICVGKLLKVMRCNDTSIVKAVQWSIDSLLKSSDAEPKNN